MHQPPGLVLTAAPAAEPVTLAEAKLWARIDTTADDAIVTSLIVAARQLAETYTQRAFVSQSWEMTLDVFPGFCGRLTPGHGATGAWSVSLRYGWKSFWDVVRLPKPPLITIDAIRYVDVNGVSQTIDPALYQADITSQPGRVRPVYGQVWPVQRWEDLAAVQVAYTCGYGSAATVPEGIKTAIKLLVAGWYKNREPGAEKSQMETPFCVTALLDQFWTGSVVMPGYGRQEE